MYRISHRAPCGLFLTCLASVLAPIISFGNAIELVTVVPEEYPSALRNPMKGFRPELWATVDESPYMTLVRQYIKWNDLERTKGDDLVANLRAYSDKKWKRFEGTGVKVIPRVYLDWDEKEGNEYWPDDMTAGDYTSPEFRERITRLIEALGECWNDDRRVAWIQMGIIGYWGEQHSPHPDEATQAFLGAAFEKAFPDKAVLIRHPNEFQDFEFGIYWDSWAHERQTSQMKHGAGVERLNERTGRWKTRPIEGETAYNWGTYKIQPGDDPNDTLSDPVHREFLIDTIRNLHATALGWISKYDSTIPEVAAGAELVQRAFGYRFVIRSFSFSPMVSSDGVLDLEFTVTNTGSAPFYEDWPLVVSLLHPESHALVWQEPIASVDIRTWLPGDDWDEVTNEYTIPAKDYVVKASVTVPPESQLSAGRYILAISIPDPNMGELGLRFAIKNYLPGDLHPMGIIGYGDVDIAAFEVSTDRFVDPMQ